MFGLNYRRSLNQFFNSKNCGVRAENSDSSKSVNVAIFSFLLTTVGQFMFLSACLSRTREVKQVFFIPIVA